MDEKELATAVRRLIEARGLYYFESQDYYRRSGAGWPDLVIIGPGGMIHRELKTESGKLTPDQRRVGAMINRHGGDFQVWRTSDLLSGIIESELDHLTAEPA